MDATRQQVWTAVKSIATALKLDPHLVMAVCEQESEKDKKDANIFRCDVARLEQGFYRRYTEGFKYATTTEILLACSYGVMQMMGQSLLERGYFAEDYKRQSSDYQLRMIDPMSEVNVPKAINRYLVNLNIQIEYGCKHLAKKLAAADGDVHKGLLFWNGGGNKAYPGEVMARYDRIKNELS